MPNSGLPGALPGRQTAVRKNTTALQKSGEARHRNTCPVCNFFKAAFLLYRSGKRIN